MAVAQGINTKVRRVKQSGLGAPGSTGSRSMRRVTLTLNKTGETYESQEIVDHQQATGAIEGPNSITGSLNGEISAGSYDLEVAGLLRKGYAATSAIASVALTIATAGSAWSITRGSGSWLTDGLKVGDVIRLSVGTLNAANISKNLLVIGIASATVCTVVPLNGVALAAEGPISGCTATVIGKKSWVPLTGHTNDYFTWERWHPDIVKSFLFTDVQPGSAEVNIPATGIPTINFSMTGLGRTIGGAEVLTSPTAATTTSSTQAKFGRIVVNGSPISVTGIQFTIGGNVSTGDAEVGSETFSDLQRGRITVSGSFTAKLTDTTLSALRDAQTTVSLVAGVADSKGDAAEFLIFVVPSIKIFSDDVDDGEKQIVATYNFTAQIPASGGAALANHQTIISVQDSQAA